MVPGENFENAWGYIDVHGKMYFEIWGFIDIKSVQVYAFILIV